MVALAAPDAVGSPTETVDRLERASPGLRAVSQVFNLSLWVGLLGSLALYGSSLGLLKCLALIAPLAVLQWLLLALTAQDVGKIIVGLRIVDAESQADAGFVRVVLVRSIIGRWLVAPAPLYPLIDTAMVYRDDHRCVHDLIAGTDVVRIRGRQSLLDWAMGQVGEFLSLIGQVLLLGVIASMGRGEFRWRAFFTGLFAMSFYVVLIGAVVFAGPTPIRGARELALWGGSMAVMAYAGFCTGGLKRGIGFWELYLGVLLTVGLIWVHMALGWDRVLGLGPGDDEVYLDLFAMIPPGVRYLGPMWDRLIVLGAIAGFLIGVVGGSFAYILIGDDGHINWSVSLEWFVARRQLSGRAGLISVTALVAMTGIGLGVAALVAVTAVMTGYQQDIQSKILSTNAHLVVQKYGIDFTEYPEITAKAMEIENLQTASPFTFNEAMVSVGDWAAGVMLKGVDPNKAGSVTPIEGNLCRDVVDNRCVKYPPGQKNLPAVLREADGLPSILVGVELFKKLQTPVGSPVTLTTPVGIAGARGNAPRRMDFRLGGAFQSGMHEFDSRLAYLELSASQRLMGLGDAVNGVEFKVDAPENIEVIEKLVFEKVGKYPFKTLDWHELNANIFMALRLQKIAMFLVLCFIVVVAAFNIASTLFMAVVEKAHEIGVIKSMGGRDGSIMKMFMLQGWTVGSIGTMAGIALGLLVAWLLSRLDIGIAADVYMVESLSVRTEPIEIALVAFSAMTIAHLASVYPALKAARQRPVDAMRYDEV